MHDLRALRADPQAFDAAMARRGIEHASNAIVGLDQSMRTLMTEQQELQARRNEASREIGARKKAGQDAQDLIDEVAGLKTRLAELDDEVREVEELIQTRLAVLPNVLDPSVPDGPDEDANVEVRRVGSPATFDFDPKEHDALGEALGMMDFERAAHLAGARFVVLKGPLARLERALAQFMLDTHTTQNGYTEVNPPLLVNDAAVFGTGQLPKFGEDLFRTTDGRWLAPTAEVMLTNLVGGRILDEKDLPIRLTAFTPCFRSEAGAAGRDTRGMIRQHQFEKVELVSITTPEQAAAEHERMTRCAEGILEALGLAYRTMLLCSGDTGFSACKTYDLEVWLPGQGRYREISSCSACADFQARRMNGRYRPRTEDKGTRFVHTLNGSGLAVGRTLVAVLETCQQADGSIRIPDVLRPYMNGLDMIGP